MTAVLRRSFGTSLAAVLTGTLVTTCAGGSSNGPPSSGSLSSGLSIQATEMGPLQTNPDVSARGEAYSTLFQGYSVWLYGATFFSQPDVNGHTAISNSWSYTTDLNASDGIAGFQERLDAAGAPTMLIPLTADEQAFNDSHQGDTTCQVRPCGVGWSVWPSTIITDPVSHHALVFYTLQSTDPQGFKGVGSSVALWQSLEQLPVRPAFSPAIVADHADLMFGQSEPSFGSAAVIRNGALYVYGCGNSLNGLDKGCRLGKVSPATVQDRTTWTFYAGGGRWSSSVGDAVSVFNGLDIMSVSWNSFLQRYVAVYAALFAQNSVVLRTASAPEGPWSDELDAFTAQPPADGSNIYDAQAHSEYDANRGQTIYVTYSRALRTAFTGEVRLVRLQLQTH